MRLRSKILLILSFVLITLFAVIYYLVQAFLIKDIILLENRLAGNDIKRLNQIIETRIDNISEKSGDWAMWNDAYNFMDNFKQDFVDANFTKEVFSNVKLNLIAFLKINGDVYYGKFFDSEKNQVIEIPDDFKKFLDEMKKFNNQILENGFLNGLAVVKNNSMMFSLKPVLTSEGTGPAKGILIFGKNIDKQELSTFSKNLNFNVNLVEPEKTELLIKEHNIKSTFVKIKNSDFLTCFLTKHDVFDNKNILFDFEIQREVYNSEINNIAIIFLTLLLLIFLIILLLYYLLSKLVIIKLTDLIRQITNIKEKNDLTLRLPEYGNDEITKLASEINEMLASLESSEKIVKENQIWFKTIFETVQTGVVLVEKNTHKIIDANPVAVKMIGTEKENIVGHICHKFICPAD
ncbi:HAMP domain-containing protein, partial [Candidatus Dependentiae bacterium]|nr:HAMP domain-containing protein [Candidatus Dependentiae bacterium]